MVIKNYTVSLEEEIVLKSKKLSKKYGGKLSPMINVLLKEWIKQEESKQK